MFKKTFTLVLVFFGTTVTFAQGPPFAYFGSPDEREEIQHFGNNPFLNNYNRNPNRYYDEDNSDSFIYPSEIENSYNRQPTYNNNREPGYTSGPTYNREPAYTREPTYNREPAYNEAPVYEETVSKSEQKCKEYSKLISNTISAIPLLVNPEQINISVSKCDYNGIPLIVGGSPASAGEFPFMAAIGSYNSDNELQWYCGGTLISERYVLTAAHCVRTIRGAPTLVRLGELDLKRDDDGSEPEDYAIEDIIVHENYRPPVKYNDIALLKLNRNVRFTQYIRPACLLNRFSLRQNKVIATGWGKTGTTEEQSDKLLKVGLTVFDNSECDRAYPTSVQSYRRILPRGITDKMMCVGELRGGKDTCQGDSGGPLVITDKNNQCLFYVVGVTSFGKSYCGAQDSPAVYTTVSQFISWIEKHIW